MYPELSTGWCNTNSSATGNVQNTVPLCAHERGSVPVEKRSGWLTNSDRIGEPAEAFGAAAPLIVIFVVDDVGDSQARQVTCSA